MSKRAQIIGVVVAVLVIIVQTVAVAEVAEPPADNPKNVILFIGDGMGPMEVELARLVSGRDLVMEGMPYSGTVNTSSLSGVTDSAAAATALATGFETYNGMLSWFPGNPPSEPETVIERAEGYEMATGLITDLKIRSATPAAFACHVEDRDDDDAIVEGMAQEDVDVLFSGGFSESRVLTDTLTGERDVFIDTYGDLVPYLGSGPYDADRVFGFFGSGSLAYTLDIEEEERVGIDPTLPELTQAAINILSQNDNGFFLMVEGGVIDYGGHARDAAWVVADTLELDEAVQVALDFAADTDTLVVVTADHETGGLEFESGDVNIAVITQVSATVEWMWGAIKPAKVKKPGKAKPVPAIDEQAIRDVLSEYADIDDLSTGEMQDIATNKEMGIADVLSARQNISWGWEGSDEGEHTGADVPVYAYGPGAEAFGGYHSENEDVGRLLINAVD